jgi:DNA polymerase III epsilon subunit-like protein
MLNKINLYISNRVFCSKFQSASTSTLTSTSYRKIMPEKLGILIDTETNGLPIYSDHKTLSDDEKVSLRTRAKAKRTKYTHIDRLNNKEHGFMYESYKNSDIYKDRYILELGFIVFGLETGKVYSEYGALRKPIGFHLDQVIKEDGTVLNNITHDIAMKEGQPIGILLDQLTSALQQADQILAYNIHFDMGFILREAYVNNRQELINLLISPAKTRFCIMNNLGRKYMKSLNITKQYNAEIVYKTLFNKQYIHTHRALDDCRTELEIYLHLRGKY